MNKTVFISSTYEDLKNYRRKAWDLLEKYDVNIRGMEKFGARTESPLETCLAEVEQSDIFIGIIGFKLGSIDETTGKSFTQREYERAYELEKEIFIYLVDEKDATVAYQYIDFGERHEKLKAFKSILKERHTIDNYVSEDSLTQKLKIKFDELLSQISEENEEIDEYDNSNIVINKFLLTPKAYSGNDVKLLVDFVENPFPASKMICKEFNLDYGATIGVKVKIKKPDMLNSFPNIVFMTSKYIDDYFAINPKNNIPIFVKLQFSENKIDNIEANFIRKELYRGGFVAFNHATASTIGEMMLGEKKIIEPEGHIILRLSELVKNAN